ncbi:TnsA-like heteromeric transposase endonuclease subunit [Geodermatophilus sp. SYSU D00703]
MTERALRSLPRNLTADTRALVRLSEGLLNLETADSLAALAVERALPIRDFYSWRGKRNYEGAWWSSTTRTLIAFNSLLEREYLMAADFDGEIVAIASQPLALLWPYETRKARSHVPDFFCRLSNGDGRLVDVRRPECMDGGGQAQAIRQVCELVGWKHEVFTGLPSQRLQNLRWLSGYRQDRFAPSEDARAHILDAFSPATSLQAGILRAARTSRAPFSIVQANALHLLFTGSLRVDIDSPLSMQTEVWT